MEQVTENPLHGSWRRVRASVLEVLLPTDCCLCACPATGTGGIPVCGACARELPRHAVLEACPRCALPVPGGMHCGRCLREPPAYDSTHALFDYGFPVDILVQALKYQHRLSLARFFAGAAEPLLEGLPEVDLVLPMPLHPCRLRERGFNQAVEIARPLARAAGLPLDLSGVARVRNTPPQASLDRERRRVNLRGAFEGRRRFDGLRIAVLDDVMTTGASLEALAQRLKALGAAAVHNLVMARARPAQL